MGTRRGRASRALHRISQRGKKPDVAPAAPELADDSHISSTGDALTGNLFKHDLPAVHEKLGKSFDIVTEVIHIRDKRYAAIVYIEGLADTKQIDDGILGPLKSLPPKQEASDWLSIEHLANDVITISNTSQAKTIDEAVTQVISSNALLLVDGERVALGLSVAGAKERGVEQPSTEAVIRGPHEAFNESIVTGTALVRKRLKTPNLRIEGFDIGRETKTKVALCYIHGIASEELVDEVRSRLQRIDTDAILESGNIEEFIEDHPFSPFPQIQNTERPDVVAGLLLEGQVSILCDGTPFALLGPTTIWGALQSAEDYYERYMVATLVRWLRYIFIWMALLLPSLYVAITTFHQEMLPSKLLLSVAAAREVTPFPAAFEALFMEVIFEALREAGIRLPKTVGSAISIVGALVIGQASVQAGLVSAPMVIIVSATGIASFTIPRYNFSLSLRMLRFPMIFLAASLGLFGIVIGIVALSIHLSSLRSFGVPFLQPVSPISWRGWQDVFVRAPLWAMRERPKQTAKNNLVRQSQDMTPSQRLPTDRGGGQSGS